MTQQHNDFHDFQIYIGRLGSENICIESEWHSVIDMLERILIDFSQLFNSQINDLINDLNDDKRVEAYKMLGFTTKEGDFDLEQSRKLLDT